MHKGQIYSNRRERQFLTVQCFGSGRCTLAIIMDSRQLQAYLKQVVSLEVQCQTADKAYQTCRNKLNQLGLPKVPPAKPVLNKTVKTEVNSKRRLSFIGRLLIILSIIFVVVTIVFPMCLGILLAATTTSVSFDAGLFRTFIIIAVIAFASGVVCILIAKRTQKQEEAKAQSQIDQQQRGVRSGLLAVQRGDSEGQAAGRKRESHDSNPAKRYSNAG